MKKLITIVSLIAVLGFAFQASAQKTVTKELLLTTLNGVAHLKFENDQVTQLMEYNEGFVDQVFVILDSDAEDKQKKESLDALSFTRKTDLHTFLTKHETNKYLKYMEDQLKPLVHKNKLLKHIAKY